ncbi:MAG: NAD(P)H-hydrate dehydratase [Bacteroidia bacterium]
MKLTKIFIKNIFKPRAIDSHKGTHGHALLIAGNIGKMGAAVISAKACLRAGTGLLTVNIPNDERIILQTAIPEAMLEMRANNQTDFTNYTALGIGPGLGLTNDSLKILQQILLSFTKPILFDADALNLMASNKKLLLKIPANSIITPHPKEFDRLFGNHKNQEERIKTAVNKSKELHIVIVLKSHNTVIANGNKTYENVTGNAGLAKGGSGDALTGIITAFLAQGYSSINAAVLGVYLHGLAADITLKKQSVESMLITDVIENLGKAFKQIQ